jgi:FMN phosphatase YigB (HAD superfamily)
MKIIFDLDDTIQADKSLRRKRERAILARLGNKAEDYRELKKTNCTTKALEKLGISRQEFYKILESVPIRLKKDKKLVKLFSKLKQNNKLIILSNSPKKCVNEILAKLGLEEYFDKVYSGNSFSNPKPSEEVFSIVEPGDICVGNSFAKDLEIPKKKGAITILVSDIPNPEAHFNIKSILELPRVLLDL